MKSWLQMSIAVLTPLILASTMLSPARAEVRGKPVGFKFDQQEVDLSKFIVLAQPLSRGYKPLVLEQIADSKACWSESGISPVTVDPLLVNFDFRGICGRSIDSNGYSIRQAGQDLVLQYGLRIEQQGDNLVLLGQPLDGMTRDPVLVLGRSHGIEPGGFNKIFLDSGWRLTRRTYDGQPTGHIYLTSDFLGTGMTTPADQSSSSAIRATPLVRQ
jgi:hypothetical protein